MQKAVIGESFFNYLIYLPKDFDGTKKYPLVLYLHGAGERANSDNEIELLKKFGPPKLCDENDYDAIIVSPQVKYPWVWNSFPDKIKSFIDEIVVKYPVDSDAISITGVSMGCFGMYQVMMDYPKTFCAGVAVCGGGLDWRCGAITEIPLKIYHGEDDATVPCAYSKEMYNKLIDYGAKEVELTIFPKMGHGIWNKVFEECDALTWLINKSKTSKR